MITLEEALQDDYKMNLFIEENEGLIHNVLKEFWTHTERYKDYEDLVQVGRMGLYYCAKRFNASKNIKFSTYASYIIKNKIIKTLHRQYNNGVKLPDCGRKIQQLYNQGYSIEEIAEMTKKTIKMISKIILHDERIVSLNDTLEDSTRELGETIESPTNIEDEVIEKLNFQENYAKLTNFQKEIFKYVVDGNMRQEDIAKRYGCSQMTISRNIKKIKDIFNLEKKTCKRNKTIKNASEVA